MLLAQNAADAAILDLEHAAQQNPLPEYQWTLAEALRAGGRNQEAELVESRLRSHGAMNDPRPFHFIWLRAAKMPVWRCD
jgi:hypothetical protein